MLCPYADAGKRHHVVVTHEKSSGGYRKIKIPNACDGLEVRHMSPYKMLGREKAKFILEPDEEVPP